MAKAYQKHLAGGVIDYLSKLFEEMIKVGVFKENDPYQLALEFYSPIYMLISIYDVSESKEDVVDMLLELREIQPEALPINFLLPIKGTPLGDADISVLTTEYCMKVLCLARLLVPKADIRCAAGREVYFKGEEKKLLSVVDSIFASGYLTEGGQGIEDTLKTITDAGFTYEIESA
mgnify:CR=1 FL=1